MSKIIFTRPEDGGVSIVTPTSGTATEALASKTVPAGVDYEIVNDNVIPTSRRFRDAWQKSGTTVVVDITKAKVIALAQLREAAVRTLEKCRLKDDLGEAKAYTLAQVQAAYQTAMTNLNTKVNAADLESCVDDFINTYELEQPQQGGY